MVAHQRQTAAVTPPRQQRAAIPPPTPSTTAYTSLTAAHNSLQAELSALISELPFTSSACRLQSAVTEMTSTLLQMKQQQVDIYTSYQALKQQHDALNTQHTRQCQPTITALQQSVDDSREGHAELVKAYHRVCHELQLAEQRLQALQSNPQRSSESADTDVEQLTAELDEQRTLAQQLTEQLQSMEQQHEQQDNQHQDELRSVSEKHTSAVHELQQQVFRNKQADSEHDELLQTMARQSALLAEAEATQQLHAIAHQQEVADLRSQLSALQLQHQAQSSGAELTHAEQRQQALDDRYESEQQLTQQLLQAVAERIVAQEQCEQLHQQHHELIKCTDEQLRAAQLQHEQSQQCDNLSQQAHGIHLHITVDATPTASHDVDSTAHLQAITDLRAALDQTTHSLSQSHARSATLEAQIASHHKVADEYHQRVVAANKRKLDAATQRFEDLRLQFAALQASECTSRVAGQEQTSALQAQHDQLQQQLEHERLLRHDAEAELHTMKLLHQTLATQLTDAHLQLAERTQQQELAAAEVAQLRQQLVDRQVELEVQAATAIDLTQQLQQSVEDLQSAKHQVEQLEQQRDELAEQVSTRHAQLQATCEAQQKSERRVTELQDAAVTAESGQAALRQQHEADMLSEMYKATEQQATIDRLTTYNSELRLQVNTLDEQISSHHKVADEYHQRVVAANQRKLDAAHQRIEDLRLQFTALQASQCTAHVAGQEQATQLIAECERFQQQLKDERLLRHDAQGELHVLKLQHQSTAQQCSVFQRQLEERTHQHQLLASDVVQLKQQLDDQQLELNQWKLKAAVSAQKPLASTQPLPPAGLPPFSRKSSLNTFLTSHTDVASMQAKVIELYGQRAVLTVRVSAMEGKLKDCESTVEQLTKEVHLLTEANTELQQQLALQSTPIKRKHDRSATATATSPFVSASPSRGHRASSCNDGSMLSIAKPTLADLLSPLPLPHSAVKSPSSADAVDNAQELGAAPQSTLSALQHLSSALYGSAMDRMSISVANTSRARSRINSVVMTTLTPAGCDSSLAVVDELAWPEKLHSVEEHKEASATISTE